MITIKAKKLHNNKYKSLQIGKFLDGKYKILGIYSDNKLVDDLIVIVVSNCGRKEKILYFNDENVKISDSKHCPLCNELMHYKDIAVLYLNCGGSGTSSDEGVIDINTEICRNCANEISDFIVGKMTKTKRAE